MASFCQGWESVSAGQLGSCVYMWIHVSFVAIEAAPGFVPWDAMHNVSGVNLASVWSALLGSRRAVRWVMMAFPRWVRSLLIGEEGSKSAWWSVRLLPPPTHTHSHRWSKLSVRRGGRILTRMPNIQVENGWGSRIFSRMLLNKTVKNYLHFLFSRKASGFSAFVPKQQSKFLFRMMWVHTGLLVEYHNESLAMAARDHSVHLTWVSIGCFWMENSEACVGLRFSEWESGGTAPISAPDARRLSDKWVEPCPASWFIERTCWLRGITV